MFNSSPIDSWEGAAAFFNYANGSPGPFFWFCISVLLCIIPILVSLKAENAAEKEHG